MSVNNNLNPLKTNLSQDTRSHSSPSLLQKLLKKRTPSFDLSGSTSSISSHPTDSGSFLSTMSGTSRSDRPAEQEIEKIILANFSFEQEVACGGPTKTLEALFLQHPKLEDAMLNALMTAFRQILGSKNKEKLDRFYKELSFAIDSEALRDMVCQFLQDRIRRCTTDENEGLGLLKGFFNSLCSNKKTLEDQNKLLDYLIQKEHNKNPKGPCFRTGNCVAALLIEPHLLKEMNQVLHSIDRVLSSAYKFNVKQFSSQVDETSIPGILEIAFKLLLTNLKTSSNLQLFLKSFISSVKFDQPPLYIDSVKNILFIQILIPHFLYTKGKTEKVAITFATLLQAIVTKTRSSQGLLENKRIQLSTQLENWLEELFSSQKHSRMRE